VLIVQTIPVVNIPSKNIDGNQCKSKNFVVNPPKHSDKKNPTHVDVHIIQEVKSPKNLQLVFNHSLVVSKIEPYTIIVLIPYDMKDQKSNVVINDIINYILLNYTQKIGRKKIIHHK
jgi:hypothetical protein